ncbi:fatty acid desaturase [Photobacterium aphoticum]|uniref:Acyl-CoA desaturase n=1 Tax=Photobacterium aphoticum TaxID=754436 RepID=A0A0J1GJU9_9GAMM|nr:fatty acid desaturase [Photobacterium aphoticum]KLU99870.1 acyl-CoA desaturase [Photobacterium aphoticum]PSU59441.1 acyl-CoA desaturase [Photobacterium aphoticum]GHA40634.1 acyl-CoA desaturase [Photobacterium aphoticum]
MTTTKPPLIWLNVIVFTSTLAIALIGTPLYAWYVGFDGAQLAMLFVAFTFCGMSITAGYHRLWSHKTYEANTFLRVLFAIGGAFALQNSILHWSSDHRIHHRHVDNNDVDPYSAKRGFFFSHIGWMLRDYHADRYHDYTNCRDLQKDPIVMWQHKYYLPLALATNIGIPLLFGLIHGDVWGALLLVGVVRLVLSHHTTFFINSLAHVWGSQPYTDNNTARDNGFLALLTFGEGYHNFHHIFENDYRNGIRWWQFDPTKWLIKSCEWVGMTKKLRVTPEDKVEKARASMLHQRLHKKLLTLPNPQVRLQRLDEEYEALLQKMADYYAAQKRMLELKKKHLLEHYDNFEFMQQYHEMKCRLEDQRRIWKRLTEQYA